jgi:septal ring factor EnvC (AmiA/AmiB activator)
MKVVLPGLVCVLLALAAPARAEQAQASSGNPAVEQKQVEQAITRQQTTVKQLQGDLAREEARIHQADAKLKQQDQAIADLQRQLEALKNAPQDAGHH